MSSSIAKTSPIKVPEGVTIKPKVANKGYYHMEYKWVAEDGYEYICRWHTRTPNAPLQRGDSWVVERNIPGIGYGENYRKPIREILVGKNWLEQKTWKEAYRAWRNNTTTELQEEILKYGHWEVYK